MGAIEDLRAGAAWKEILDGEAGVRAGALIRRTPLLEAPSLAADGRARSALVKAEGLQRTGSFKIRGAAGRLAALSTEEADRGVVAASAGNHGLGIAAASRAMGIEALIVVPETSPEVKRSGIAALGATLEVRGGTYDEAEHEALAVARERGAAFISGFDDEYVIAGNGGTLGRELSEQAGGLGAGDVVVIPVGGGGLASGIAGAIHGTGATLLGVEPAANHAMRDSFDRGRAATEYPEGRPTMAEGLEGAVSPRTFAICREALADIVLAKEPAIARAMARAYRELGLVLEASAAVTIAALAEGLVDAGGGRVLCIATGSNVDAEVLDAALASEG